MVVVRIMGGLGNQLFEYAAGRRLALVNSTSLKLDISDYGISPKPYRLDKFNIIAGIASPSDVERLTGMRRQNSIPGRLVRRVRRYLPFRKNRVIPERSTGFQPFADVTGDVYLDGYWQSEMYFNDITDVVRSEFKLKQPPDEANRAIATAISECESVCLHVRRGDYVSNPLYNRVHGTCPLEYYQAAVAILTGRVRNPHFFVFSDDLGWVKDNLKLDHRATYVDQNGEEQDYEDLRLMSLCKHHIIANSSFSWWGAWLSADPEKIVIAPNKWFSDPNRHSCDIVPSSWWRL